MLFLRWLFNLNPDYPRPTEQAEILLRSFHITSKCRYNASIRLKRLGKFTFITSIVLSVGLILVPTFLLAGLNLAYPTAVINCLQLFLAVSVLVYSVIGSSAGYETRVKSLNDCGDRIKDLSRDLRSAIQRGQAIDFDKYSDLYSSIIKDSEMHTRSDYALAVLQARDTHRITGLPRLMKRSAVSFIEGVQYVVPVSLMVIELILILDILGITTILTEYFIQLVKSG